MKAKIRLELLTFIAGMLLTAAGAYQIYPPAGLIVPGIVLMAISLFGERQK